MGFGNCPGCRRWIDRAIFRFRFRFHVHVQVKFQCPYLLWMEAVVIFVWNVVEAKEIIKTIRNKTDGDCLESFLNSIEVGTLV